VKNVYIFSHSVNALKIFQNYSNLKFELKWLEKLYNKQYILSFDDEMRILEAIGGHVSDFGLAMRIKNKFLDPFSLVVFSSIMRIGSFFNYNILAKSKCSKVSKTIRIYEGYYKLISNYINHNRGNYSLKKLYNINKNLFGFNDTILDCYNFKNIEDIFDLVTEDYSKIKLKKISKKGKIDQIKDNDVSLIIVWKYLLVLKIRRLLEYKTRKKFGINSYEYKELSTLFNHKKVDKNSSLYMFYKTYCPFFNSFHHSSDEFVPPFVIHPAEKLQEIYFEIKNL